MEAEIYHENIINVSGGTVIKRKNPIITIGAVITLFFSVLMLSLASLIEEKSTVTMALLTFGAVGTATGLFGAFIGGKNYLFTPTNSIIEKCSVHFSDSDLPKIYSAIKTSKFEEISKLKPVDESGTKIDVWKSIDGKFAAVQLFELKNRKFMPTSPIIYVPLIKISHIADCLLQAA